MNPRQRFAQYIKNALEGNLNEGELYQTIGMDPQTYTQGSRAPNRISRSQKVSDSVFISKGRT